MRITVGGVLRDAVAVWRGNWDVLTAIGGVFVLLPQLASALLIPAFPDITDLSGVQPDSPAFVAWRDAMAGWMQSYALWWCGAALVTLFGQFALVAVHLAPEGSSVGDGLRLAARLFPRFVLASLLWSMPLALAGVALLVVPFLLMPVFALIMARMLLIAPALVAQRPIGAAAAIGRSFVLTRGNTLMLAAVVLIVLLLGVLLGAPLAELDRWLTTSAPNPVARAAVDLLLATEQAAIAIAMALAQIAAWRRLRG